MQKERGRKPSEVGYGACDFNLILTITEIINITIPSLRSVFGSVCQFLVPTYFVQKFGVSLCSSFVGKQHLK